MAKRKRKPKQKQKQEQEALKESEWLWDVKRDQWYHKSIKGHREKDNKPKRRTAKKDTNDT